MKRFSKILALIVLTVTALSMLFACAPTAPSDPTPPPVEKITLNKSVASMDLYETLTLTASKENLTGEVVWTSSDTSKATVNGGVVTSLAEGEVTVTASVGDKSATCTITIVSSGQVPVLTLGSTEETIKAGNTFIVTPTLNYKGNTLNATFAYSVEDSEIVSVLDGVITALKPGSTTVTVTATYLGYQTYENISVTVIENVSFTLSETSLVLGTSEVADYKKSATVNAEIYENGQLLSSPSITWKSADDEIATVNGGVITATGVGEVIISATYTSNGKDFTVNLPVVVEKPTVSVAFDDLIDLNGQSGENASVDLSELFEDTSYTADNVVKITDITGEDTIDIAFTAQNTAVSFKKSAMATGERVIGVELDDITYAVSVTVVTKVITTADELLALESYAPNVKSITWELWGNTGTEESYDGYFVLGANIDLGDREVQNINEHKYLRIWKDAEEGAGFCGVFDGRGYTINGGVYKQGGLFGYLWKTGVIKNVAFTNATISSEQYSSIIGISVWGTIENVLFHVTKSEL
ncbi:MAG: Ig-like domain-containing protein, partial [Clostridia bacterium]|nr:Ig-like domain-containing protein [Clostridia bacterium]